MALLSPRRTDLRLACLFLICAACLVGCAAGSSREGELPTQREHNALKAMILAQPEFTERELLKFAEDITSTVDMPKDDALAYLEASKGWPQNRATYMILKMGMATESLLAGKDYAAIFSIIPSELYPSSAETALVRKHRDLVTPLFMPQNVSAAPQAATGSK